MTTGFRITLMAGAVVITAAAAVIIISLQSRHQHRMECLNNLRQIESAVINLAYERGYYRGDIVPESQIAEVIGHDQKHIPFCPSGGHYVTPAVGGNPTCSVHGAPFAPGGELFGPPNALELGLRDRPSK